jgi:hypothetical protein
LQRVKYLRRLPRNLTTRLGGCWLARWPRGIRDAKRHALASMVPLSQSICHRYEGSRASGWATVIGSETKGSLRCWGAPGKTKGVFYPSAGQL